MKKSIIFLLVFMAILFANNSVLAQNIPTSEEEVKEELDKRGLTEEEVTQALLDNGIDIENIENASPEQLLEIQKIINQLEQDKKNEEVKLNDFDQAKIVVDTVKVEEDELLLSLEDTIIKKLDSKIYGHEILNRFISASTKHVNVNENYILGFGDKISISVWSNYSQFDNSFTINKEGYLKVETRTIKKRIYLKGMTLHKAKEKIKMTLSNYLTFKTGEINISLESTRNINISVYGEVTNPGSYTTNATSTIFEGINFARGVSEIASVRYIKVIKSNGKNNIFDLYKYLENPQYKDDFFLSDNDIIHVPVAQKLITISGAVKRNFTFELLENEGIKELIYYAGGFQKDAIKNKVQLVRYVDKKRVFIDVDVLNNNGKISDFKLLNGDRIFVDKITAEYNNYIKIKGSVYNPRKFELLPNMHLSDAIRKAGLMPNAKTDFAIITRKNEDGTKNYLSFDIKKVQENIGIEEIDFALENEDVITIWSKMRYSDKMYFSVIGAVREPDKYPYGTIQSIRVLDAINIAGGLARDASSIVIIHRQDPLKTFEKQYIKLDLDEILGNPYCNENVVLKPYDELEVLSDNSFNEKSFVIINGAVNNPNRFQYGKNMTLSDLITMAGGFKLMASTNNIEISRVIIKNNEPTKVTVAKVDFDKNSINKHDDSSSFKLKPYDIVMVRNVPEFEMQKMITLTGEVKYPGEYTLISNNERISSVIKRAGGLSDEAFAEGASIYRNKDDIGYIVLRLQEAMNNNYSKFNYILKDGDVLDIPKQKDFVTIQGAIRASKKYKDEIASNKSGINVPFHKGKRSMYYINNYGGGVSKEASKKNILVEHPNGEISKTYNYGLFKIYPEVRKGSVIKVSYKKKKSKKDKDKKDIDWNKIISDSVAQISTIMTLVILFKSISQ